MNTEAEILEFLKVKENTGALLLTGKWGCGKSYLIKKLATKLNTKTSKYYISLISLFGIDSISTLNRCVKEAYLAASSGVFTKTVRKAAQGVSNLIKSGAEVASAVDPTSAVSAGIAKGIGNAMALNVFDYVPIKNEFGRADKKKEFVLVFDDLERCKINIVDLLGAINEYSENKKIKTIIIADEEKILKSDVKNEYSDFKEKIIFQTIKLESDYDEIIENIISQYQETEEGYLEFIKTHKYLLKQVFYESNYNNIRTVKALLSSFERVFGEWNKTTISTARLEDVFYSFSAVYFAHKANQYKKTSYGFYDDKEIKEKHKRYDPFYLLLSAQKWITDGYWNADSFIEELTRKFCAVKVSDEQRFLQHDFWDLNENIIQKSVPIVLEKAYNGELCFNELINLIYRLHLLETYHVPLLVDVDFSAIESGLNTRLKKIRDGIIVEPKTVTTILPEDVKQLNSIAQDIYNMIELENDRRSAWETRLAVIQKLKNFEGVNIYIYKNRSIVSFDDEFLDIYYDAYVHADNGDKRDLYLLLKEIDFTNIIISRVPDFELTIKNLKLLLEKMRDLYQRTTDAFAKAIINSTIIHLPEIIEEIKQKKEEIKQK